VDSSLLAQPATAAPHEGWPADNGFGERASSVYSGMQSRADRAESSFGCDGIRELKGGGDSRRPELQTRQYDAVLTL
jgi:hypothetical protein